MNTYQQISFNFSSSSAEDKKSLIRASIVWDA